jgi:hypothetical protein
MAGREKSGTVFVWYRPKLLILTDHIFTECLPDPTIFGRNGNGMGVGESFTATDITLEVRPTSINIMLLLFTPCPRNIEPNNMCA